MSGSRAPPTREGGRAGRRTGTIGKGGSGPFDLTQVKICIGSWNVNITYTVREVILYFKTRGVFDVCTN